MGSGGCPPSGPLVLRNWTTVQLAARVHVVTVTIDGDEVGTAVPFHAARGRGGVTTVSGARNLVRFRPLTVTQFALTFCT